MSLYPGRWRALLLRLCAPDCACPAPGKSPHVEGPGWQRAALARLEGYSEPSAAAHAARVRAHARAGGNVGLALPPYAVALDCDTDLDGAAPVPGAALAADAILAVLDEHPAQRSGKADAAGRRVGVHVFGSTTDRRVYGTHYGSVPVTIRGVGNQVAVAPSRHRSGHQYEWLRELPADPALLPPLDVGALRHEARVGSQHQMLKRELGEASEVWRQRVSAAWLAELSDPDVRFAAGRRHDALLYLAWHLTTCGATPEEVDGALWDLVAARCAPYPVAERRALAREIRDLVRDSARRYAEGWEP
jgi:hypothetical protein